jgi:hypothetical protein
MARCLDDGSNLDVSEWRSKVEWLDQRLDRWLGGSIDGSMLTEDVLSLDGLMSDLMPVARLDAKLDEDRRL